MQTIIIILSLLYGLVFGSFANVVIYRLPRKESLVKPSSRCPSCGQRLSVFDLIPVLSWIMLGRRCRYCKVKISWRYPMVEALCAALFALTAVFVGPQIEVVPLCLFTFVLLCVSFIDADTQEIPDGLLIFGAVVGVAWVTASHFFYIGAPVWHSALLGALVGSLPIFLIDRLTILLIGKDGFGFGDVKFMAMAGLFLGPKVALLSLFLAVVAGGLFGSLLLLTRRVEKGSYFAFGPFLAMGVLAALWFGSYIMTALRW